MKGGARLVALTMLGVVVALVVVFLGGESAPTPSPTLAASARPVERAPTTVANPRGSVPTAAPDTDGGDTSEPDAAASALNLSLTSAPPPTPAALANDGGNPTASPSAAAGVPEATASTGDLDDAAGLPALWCFRARSGFDWQEADDRAAPQHALVSDGRVIWSGSASARLDAADATLPGSVLGVLWQAVAAAPFGGKRVEVSVLVRSEIAQPARAFLFMRTQTSDRLELVLSDQGAPGARGLNQYFASTREWLRLNVVHDVPAEADVLYYGVALFGGGHVWLDDVRVAVVDETVALTHYGSIGGIPPIPIDPAWVLPAPANLDFELDAADASPACTRRSAG